MRRLTPLLAVALVATLASPLPALADRNGAVVAGVLLGALIAGAANRNRQNHRYDFSTDQAFYPAGMPGVTCYVRAQQCYEDGNYSRWATRQVFR